MKNEILFIPGGGAIGLLGKAKNTLDWAKNAIMMTMEIQQDILRYHMNILGKMV
ncbi:hypothetical protein [Enterococcus sp. DIV0212c]|uniref:hypothetical protein n=1 Tax=Enterococcus sp. DIV0212c TaxID=2230867 RepID=UPI001AC8B959|nr:hypothetical protein [Enterococcus sp. DIV0212c]